VNRDLDAERILYLSEREVAVALTKVDAVAVIADALKRHAWKLTKLPAESYLSWQTPEGAFARSLGLPGLIQGETAEIGLKIINSSLANEPRGLPRASGLTLLFCETTARVKAIVGAARISALRTACVTAIAVDLLGTARVESLAVSGAGVLAKAHLDLLLDRLPELRVVRIFDVSREKSRALAAALRAELGDREVSVEVSETAKEAVIGADVVVPVTTTTTGYIEAGWLQPGALVVNVSLDDPLPEVMLKADRLVVDDWGLVRADDRRLLGRMWREGLIADSIGVPADGRRPVDAELGEIVAGLKPGRRRPDEVIVVNPFGLGILDVAVAHEVYRAALKLGLGSYVER